MSRKVATEQICRSDDRIPGHPGRSVSFLSQTALSTVPGTGVTSLSRTGSRVTGGVPEERKGDTRDYGPSRGGR